MRHFVTLTAGLASLSAAPASAALLITDLTAVTEDFDFLSTASGITWVDDQETRSTTGSPGWYWQSDGLDKPYDASAGGNGTASPYSYGAFTVAERAMGNLAGGDNDNTAWGLVIENGTGQTLQSLNLSFTAEQWRTPTSGQTATSTERISFNFRVASTEPTDLEISSGFTPGGWTEVAALGFGEISTAGDGAVDGNSAAFSTDLTAAFNATIAPGEFIALRWYDGDESAFDYGLAIDDLTVTFTAIPEPAAPLFGSALAGLLGVTVARRRATVRD